MSAPAFEFVDAVTSDLSFVAWGATLDDAFAAAAQALLAEPDLELLLLRFLNELVYLRDAELLVLRPRRLRVSLDSGARLEAELAGERIAAGRHRLASDVKAATAHGLSVSKTSRGWEARVTLDV